jgi:O-antigen ligase
MESTFLEGIGGWYVMQQVNSPKLNIANFSIVMYIFLTMISESTGDILTKIARIVLTIFIVLYFIKRLRIPKISFRYIIWNLFFLLYCSFGCLYAFSKSYAIDQTISLFYVAVCNILIAIYLSSHMEMIDTTLKIVIWGALFKAFICFIQNGFLVFLDSRATEGTSANTIGLYCAFACIISFYLAKNEKHKIYYLLGIVNLIFLALSASRKAILYMLIPIAVMQILKNRNPLKIAQNILLVCIASGVIFFLLMRTNFLYVMIGHRIESMMNGVLGIGTTDSSTSTRLQLISQGMEWYSQRPISGYGLNNFRALRAAYFPNWSAYYAHNNYVELLVDCGLVGTIIFYSMHMDILMKAFKSRRKLSALSNMLIGMLVSILVCDFGMVSYDGIFIHLMLMIMYLNFSKISDKSDLIRTASGF